MLKEHFKRTKDQNLFTISFKILEMLMRPSLRRKLLFIDSNNSNTCSSRKIPESIKPEKLFLLIDSRLNLQLLKVNSMSLEELGKMPSQLRMTMTQKRLDLDK